MGGFVILLHFMTSIGSVARFGAPVSILAAQVFKPGIQDGQVQNTAQDIL